MYINIVQVQQSSSDELPWFVWPNHYHERGSVKQSYERRMDQTGFLSHLFLLLSVQASTYTISKHVQL